VIAIQRHLRVSMYSYSEETYWSRPENTIQRRCGSFYLISISNVSSISSGPNLHVALKHLKDCHTAVKLSSSSLIVDVQDGESRLVKIPLVYQSTSDSITALAKPGTSSGIYSHHFYKPTSRFKSDTSEVRTSSL
jgi:hypothetical protein